MWYGSSGGVLVEDLWYAGRGCYIIQTGGGYEQYGSTVEEIGGVRIGVICMYHTNTSVGGSGLYVIPCQFGGM